MNQGSAEDTNASTTAISAHGNQRETVMVIDDDPIFVKMLVHHLSQENYNCLTLDDLSNLSQQHWLDIKADIFILDYELGLDIKGLELCRTIKSQVSRPVLMLTGDGSETTVVECLDAGADQFMVKPYKKSELMARLRSTLRSFKHPAKNDAQARDLDIELAERRVRFGKNSVQLTERELGLLEMFMHDTGNGISRDTAHIALSKSKSEHVNSRSVDVLVGRLRKKLASINAPYVINHIRNQGYVLAHAS